jgi:shikimate kinase
VQRNIIITGFMGTGKSTVGELVSHRLDRHFIDMDVLIEQRENRTIPEIFADAGEPYFRQLEASLCVELANERGLVVATGGGTLVAEQNLQVMTANGLVVCLNCEPTILWQRIGHSQNRPMLAELDSGRFARLATLLEQRRPAYDRIEQHLDVTYLTPKEAAVKIIQIFKEQ